MQAIMAFGRNTTPMSTALRGLLIGALLALLAACGSDKPDRSAPLQNDAAAPEVDTAKADGTLVLMKTSLGDIELSLDAEKAPISVVNFLAYTDSGFYEGTVFHRVIAGFMVQGGGFDQDLQQKDTQNPIQNESANGLKNVTYSIAMARTQVWNSATAQFYINVADNASLDEKYAVFGQVVAGADVVDKIAAVQTGAGGRFGSDVPVETIVIESVSRK